MNTETRPPRTVHARYPAEGKMPAWRIEIMAHGEHATAIVEAPSPSAVAFGWPDADTEWIAGTATRALKCTGFDFTGWVVDVARNPSDPIPRKRDALRMLRDTVRTELRAVYLGEH